MNGMADKKENFRSAQEDRTVTTDSDADEELTDEEYYRKYLANDRLDSDALVQEQAAFTEAVQKELRRETAREARRLETDPSLAGQEPSPELLDRILVGMEVIRERESGTEAAKGTASDEKEEFYPDGDASDTKEEARSDGAGETIVGEDTEIYNPEAYLSEEDLRALEIGRRRLRRPMRRRIIRALSAAAAVLVCVLVVSVSSEANRVRIANAFNVLIGKEALIRINNDEENRGEYSLREIEARKEIEEKVGIKSVQFMYYPEHLIFDGYDIKTASSKAALFYQYQDTIFTIYMEKKEEGTARGGVMDGEILETFSVDTQIGELQIMELKADMEYKYATEFVYDNTYYKAYGALPREEFVKIIESLFF